MAHPLYTAPYEKFPTPRQVALKAFECGSLSAIICRPSRKAASGLVLVCHLYSFPRADALARFYAWLLDVSIRVRSRPPGWSVSVPVRNISSRLPAGVCILIDLSHCHSKKALIAELLANGLGF